MTVMLSTAGVGTAPVAEGGPASDTASDSGETFATVLAQSSDADGVPADGTTTGPPVPAGSNRPGKSRAGDSAGDSADAQPTAALLPMLAGQLVLPQAVIGTPAGGQGQPGGSGPVASPAAVAGPATVAGTAATSSPTVAPATGGPTDAGRSSAVADPRLVVDRPARVGAELPGHTDTKAAGAMPNDAMPNDAVSNDAVSNGAVSNGAVSNGAASNRAMSNVAMPNAAMPNEAMPLTPNAAAPVGSASTADAAPQRPSPAVGKASRTAAPSGPVAGTAAPSGPAAGTAAPSGPAAGKAAPSTASPASQGSASSDPVNGAPSGALAGQPVAGTAAVSRPMQATAGTSSAPSPDAASTAAASTAAASTAAAGAEPRQPQSPTRDRRGAVTPATAAPDSGRSGQPAQSLAGPAMPPVGQSQPTAPAAPAPPASAQPAAPHLAQQLATPLLRLRAGGDGSHSLTIALHPAELGPVSVHVRLLGDAMTIQLASTNQSAHDALREALPQLHRELQAAGLPDSGLSLQLSDQGTGGSAGSAGHPATEPRRTTSGSQAAAADTPAARTENRSRSADSSLDRWL